MGNQNDTELTAEKKHAAAVAEYERVLREEGPIAAAAHRLARPSIYTAPVTADAPVVTSNEPTAEEIATVKTKYEELKRENVSVASSYRLANMHAWRAK